MQPRELTGAQVYAQSLPHAERHLATRLEGFGDIVFGFSMSQLALQLAVPQKPEDLVAHPIKYLIYFVTFAILVVFWLRYHRTLATGFRPERRDLILAFTFLAFMGLIPYAMNANLRFGMTANGSIYGFAAYLICWLVANSTALLLTWRNLGRAWNVLDESERNRLYRSTGTSAYISVLCAALLIIDLTAGVAPAGFLSFLFVFAGLAGRAFTTVPGPLRERLAATANAQAAVTAASR